VQHAVIPFRLRSSPRPIRAQHAPPLQ
jgi:hypothetical protein